MRTQLSEFCERFDRELRPILDPLGTLIAKMAESKAPVAQLRKDLSELRHQLRSLVQKVENQQAYVLIFGPLKSGKSTLMNAVSASYVSEVSSLPAYPCLVFVSHGITKEFVLTDYDGNTESFTDNVALQTRIEEAHSKLAECMREIEEGGEAFDPQEHFPAAIRRVDVKVPAKNLAESGAVLVDTPGLYTRMRFGYDRMTQEFRSAAACAIFVVKSDTLFLEQVFAEFHHLLQLFSRIFLVVNMDTTKRDVGPDGKLIPSLEQRAPARIIQAFENLAMTAPIKKATSEGKVRIYPADLMSAASVALQGSGKMPAGFESFRDDLKEYLGSIEYLKAFLGDSLRQAQGLAGETRHLISGQEIAELKAESANLETSRGALTKELQRLTDCLEHDWSKNLARFAGDIEAELKRRAPDLDAKLSRAMSAAIDTWFLSGHSLQWLIDKQWKPLLQEYREDVQMVALGRFEESCVQSNAGVDLDPELEGLLRFFQIEIRELRRTAQETLGKPVWQALPDLLIDPETIPIRRGVFNVLAMQSVDKVRRRLFGADERPDNKIPPKVKAARLGDQAKQAIRRSLALLQKGITRKTLTATSRRYGMRLEAATAAEVARRLRLQEPGLREELDRLGEESACIKNLLDPVSKLSEVIDRALAGIEALSKRYAETDPALLLQPLADEPIVELPAAPRRVRHGRSSSSKRSKRRSGR